jgi:hypothetical protein
VGAASGREWDVDTTKIEGVRSLWRAGDFAAYAVAQMKSRTMTATTASSKALLCHHFLPELTTANLCPWSECSAQNGASATAAF